ncbi:Vacuolar amino acid transporter 6 [Diplonema papillatum]|nr:Vacuolar amino acid transporter 6 [Diplonema papillatum]
MEDEQEKVGLLQQNRRWTNYSTIDGGDQPPTWLSKVLPEGSMQAGVFNIASATLGAGALTLPYAFRRSGLGLGVIVLFSGMLATVYSIKLLITVLEAVRYSPAWTGPRNLDSYEDLTLHLFGRRTEFFVEFQIIAFCYGTAIAYIVAVGDILDPVRKLGFMPSLVKDHYGRQLVIIVFWTLFMFPLSLLKSVNSLRFSSMLGVVSILTLVAACVYHCSIKRLTDWRFDCPTDDPHCDVDLRWFRFDGQTLLALPLIMLAYTCQVNVFSIYGELKNATPQRMMKISWLGMFGLCFMVYATMGVFGYLEFLGDTDGNILNNYEPKNNVFLAVAFVAIALTVVVAFPLVVFPCRDSIFQLWMGAKAENDRLQQIAAAVNAPGEYEVTSRGSSHVYMPGPGAAGGLPRVYPKPSSKRHYIVSIAISFSALLFALAIPEIQVVFSFLGGICSSFLCFVLPAAFIKKMRAIETEYWDAHRGAVNYDGHTEAAEEDAYPDLWKGPGLPHDTWNNIGIELLYWGGMLAGIGSTVVTAVSL